MALVSTTGSVETFTYHPLHPPSLFLIRLKARCFLQTLTFSLTFHESTFAYSPLSGNNLERTFTESNWLFPAVEGPRGISNMASHEDRPCGTFSFLTFDWRIEQC